ncbi:MAG: exodeoxyribonuclease V subunit beta [Methylomicrobium sp.]
MNSEHFDPVTTELRQGINLIEASAGTGKTYAIAMLALRFVVERDMRIDELLVVTFTKAATEELKDRIRARLAEAKRAESGDVASVDPNVSLWLDSLEIDREQVQKRLELALLDIDRAAVFTIHGFCQRILKEHALESGQLFDSELTSELSAIKQACTDDFWRCQVYQRKPWEAALLMSSYATPDSLLAGIDRIPPHIDVFPAYRELDELFAACRDQIEIAKSRLDETAAELRRHLADNHFKANYTDHFDAHLDRLRAWLFGESFEMPDGEALTLLTKSGLFDALNGSKFRSTKVQSGEQRKLDYLAAIAIDTDPFDRLFDAIQQVGLAFRRALLEHLRVTLDKRMHQLNVLSFDDLIVRLAEALQNDQGPLLKRELRQRFRAALIDEFQDTDQNQWFIFSSLFGADSHYLYLIGDPKQAIYKFRGADIFSYLAAQQQAHHRFTLGTNWRSQPKLVEAVNALFDKERAFFLEALSFQPVGAAPNNADKLLIRARQPLAPMVLWQLATSDDGHWSAGKAEEQLRTAVVDEIVALLNGDVSLQDSNRRIRPSDIAILVRTNQQAKDYQAWLREAGVPSVLNSTESVFASQEATDLYCLLQAVAHPGDTRLLKQAIALDWFGLDGIGVYRTLNQETVLDDWLSRFLRYYQLWQDRGLMAMMRQLLDNERVRIKLSETRLAERRLTNVLHLIELLQQAAVEEHLGLGKTIDYLRGKIAAAPTEKGSIDEQCIRLESDADAVKIVTMHRSKGLEYPIVFCPSLWQRSSRLFAEKHLILCHENGRIVADLGSADFERRREQALDEELAEDLRLLYVAVTRAKYRCYVAWADVRTNGTPNRSAFAWLLGFAETDFSEQQKVLEAFRDQHPESFDYRLVEVPTTLSDVYRQPDIAKRLTPKIRQRSLHTDWQMSSYTALSALSLQETPELPQDKAREPQIIVADVDDVLPRGAHTGNVVHHLLEHIAFDRIANGIDIAETRDKACARYGLKLDDPTCIDRLLNDVVTTPLDEQDTDFKLMNLPDTQCLKEMPFYLAMRPMNAARINAILQDSPAFQALSEKKMSGYLTGFIDLICEYDGRFYVMDYKTNSLADYRPETLTEAMREHNYGLQYWLYTVVLHRYLQQRIADYDYQRHFGGVRYLFVRGMRPEQPMSGVYRDRPELQRIEALAQLFMGNTTG